MSRYYKKDIGYIQQNIGYYIANFAIVFVLDKFGDLKSSRPKMFYKIGLKQVLDLYLKITSTRIFMISLNFRLEIYVTSA